MKHFLIPMLLLCGCRDDRPEKPSHTESVVVHSVSSKYTYNVTDIVVFKVDGCEYVGAFGPNRASIVHKANCRNH